MSILRLSLFSHPLSLTPPPTPLVCTHSNHVSSHLVTRSHTLPPLLVSITHTAMEAYQLTAMWDDICWNLFLWVWSHNFSVSFYLGGGGGCSSGQHVWLQNKVSDTCLGEKKYTKQSRTLLFFQGQCHFLSSPPSIEMLYWRGTFTM